MSDVTIAIPTYRRGVILKDTLEQLATLPTAAAEILVVDQTEAHPPEVAAWLAGRSEQGAIRLLHLEQPSIPRAMNLALKAARTPIVLFVDDDIVPTSDLAFEHQMTYKNHADAWAVVGQVLQPGEEVEHHDETILRGGALRDLDFRFNHDTSTDVENAIGCNLSVSRDRALQLGGFDANFLAAAYRFESDFARRVVLAGGRIRFEPRASIRHLHVPSGGTRAHGDFRRTTTPAHAAGLYYFALLHIRPFAPYALRRFIRNVVTRWNLLHPWTLPAKVIAEIRGLRLARRLIREGRRFET